MSQSQKLKQTIDRMVEDAIRRILPEVMNEVLIKAIANANVIQERSPRQVAQTVEKYDRIKAEQPPAYRNAKNVQMPRKPSSLSQLLDEAAGADFYKDPYDAMAGVTEEPPPAQRPIAQRIQTLPPALQGLAEGIELDDDGGEMWDDQYGDSAVTPAAPMGPPIEKAAGALGLDFSRMKAAINVTEKKKRVDAEDRAANAQFEQARLKRMREQLNGGKPLE